MDITIPPGETATIWLPGATAIRVDAEYQVIAVDTTSTNFAVGEPLIPEWLMQDLRASEAPTKIPSTSAGEASALTARAPAGASTPQRRSAQAA